MADQPVAPDESFDKAGVSLTTLSGDNIKYAFSAITAPEVPTGGGGSGGTSAHGFVT